MKLMQKLFHWMMNRSLKFQGCSSIDTGTAKDLDIPLLSVTLGICNLRYSSTCSKDHLGWPTVAVVRPLWLTTVIFYSLFDLS